MDTHADTLKRQLADWVAFNEQNGIKQHDARWKDEKVFTIGGSSISTLMNVNPFATVPKMISEKIGLTTFSGDIKPQWGNLFEDVIKRYVEIDRKCTIDGEDLFIKGPPGTNTSYSPDGLTVIDVTETTLIEEMKTINGPNGPIQTIEMYGRETVTPEIVLIEFKCPYSRLPNGIIPKYYVPQVKMGLQLLDLPTTGLFIEGVFRRCTWPDLGNNPLFDTSLVPKKLGDMPKAFGIIGFYSTRQLDEPLLTEYINYYAEIGNNSNSYMCNDLGDSPPELFTKIMSAYDKKNIHPWYGSIVSGDSLKHGNDLVDFSQFCLENNYTVVGMLPWKLFHIDYHFIKKEAGYIDKLIPQINEVITIVKECLNLEPEQKARRYAEYINKLANDKFN